MELRTHKNFTREKEWQRRVDDPCGYVPPQELPLRLARTDCARHRTPLYACVCGKSEFR
jgi:hypothetical protein